MPLLLRHALAIVLALLFCAPLGASFGAWATQPKVDPDTCSALRLEQIKFRASGIFDDISKGPQWAKANLPADRLREIEHYIQLDEQVKFGCRDAKLSPDAERASEAAARIELNSDADPTAPVAHDPPKPGSQEKKDVPKKASHKKLKPSDPKAENDKTAKSGKSKISQDTTAPAPPVIVQQDLPVASRGDARPAETASDASPPYAPSSLPAFGFGETVVMPHLGP